MFLNVGPNRLDPLLAFAKDKKAAEDIVETNLFRSNPSSNSPPKHDVLLAESFVVIRRLIVFNYIVASETSRTREKCRIPGKTLGKSVETKTIEEIHVYRDPRGLKFKQRKD